MTETKVQPVVRVPVPVVRQMAGNTRVDFTYTGALGDGVFRVEINRHLEIESAALGAACAALFLLPSMTIGARLELEAPLDPALWENLEVLREIFRTWYPDKFERSGSVVATAAMRREWHSYRRGIFFSGGVDSTYSVLRHRAPISELVFVVGFDIAHGNNELAKGVTSSLRDAAKRFDLPMMEILTDLRDFSDRHVHWGSHYCGAAMAGVAHLLAASFGEMIVPGSVTWKDSGAFGTHPFIDERWSSPWLRIHHDSCDMDRLEKIRTIVENVDALRHLRVCWRNPDNSYNCCHCEKCLRAIANLRALGALEHATTFPRLPEIAELRSLEIDHELVVPFIEQTIHEARLAGDEELAEALDLAIASHRVAILGKLPKELLAELPNSRVWREEVFSLMRASIVEAAYAADPEWTRAKILNRLPAEARQSRQRIAKRPWWKLW
ncbi:MAG: hypothetical protein ACKO2G_14605 [Verrucomicrobiales bacterium]